MKTVPSDAGQRTVLGVPRVNLLLLFVGIPLLVLALGLGLPPAARWLLSWHEPLPFRFVIRLFGGIDRPWEIAVNLAIWLSTGFGIAMAAVTEALKITLTDEAVLVDKDRHKRSIPRVDVDTVFLDGRHLDVLDRESRYLVRDVHEASRTTLAAAFRRHHYPWQEIDPYADLYRRWVIGSPDLPPAVNDVLAARESALRKRARTEALDLRSAVENLGYTVRDDGSRQFWRPLVRSI